MAIIKIKSGLKTDLGARTLQARELGYCTDTQELFIGTESGAVLICKVKTLDSATGPILSEMQLGYHNGKLYIGKAGANEAISGLSEQDVLTLIAGKAATAASPAITNGTAVVGTSTDYARQDHNHKITAAVVTGALGFTPENAAKKNTASGYAGLDANAKIPTSLLPDVILGALMYGGNVNASGACVLSSLFTAKYPNITELTLSAANAANYTGVYFVATANASSGVPSTLGVKTGDWIISNGGDTTSTTGWSKVDNTDAVTGVKGEGETSYRTGNVNISKSNIGLGNVDNTSDLNKPISTEVQTALNGKENALTSAGSATIAEADLIPFTDVSASNATKRTTFTLIKSALKTYFDGYYNKYVLPLMTASVRGGAKIDNTSIKINDSEQLYVNEVDGGKF